MQMMPCYIDKVIQGATVLSYKMISRSSFLGQDPGMGGGGGVLPYKGLIGTCGQPGYVFRNFCLKQGIKFISFCLTQGIGLSIFVLNKISLLR